MNRKICLFVFSLLCCLVLCIGYSEKIMSDIDKSGIVRLHIIANSNSAADQSLKLSVRDKLLKTGIFEKAQISLEEINKICAEEIKKCGKAYGAKSETGRFYFPTKSYKNIHLPAGEYNALRVILGEGKGENWWCVMYPPLCFGKNSAGEMTAENEEKLKEMLTEESFNLVSGEEIEFVPAFRVVELWQEIKEKIKNRS